MVPFPIVVLEWKKNKENNYSKILYLTCVLSSCQNTVRFWLASFIVDKTGSALKLAQNQYILVTSLINSGYECSIFMKLKLILKQRKTYSLKCFKHFSHSDSLYKASRVREKNV